MPSKPRKSFGATSVASSLLVLHSLLLGYGACAHSPTLNEPGHLVSGISYWNLSRFGFYNVNPPLVKLVAAIPVVAAGCETNWSSLANTPGIRRELAVGHEFCQANGERVLWLMTIARWSCIPFSLIGAMVCFKWAETLYGGWSGVFAMSLWCFSPNILAHGQLVTCDVASASLGSLACYVFWGWLKSPTWRKTISSGVLLGLAESAKFTLLVFYIFWPILWVLYRLLEGKPNGVRTWLREFAMICVRMLVSILVLSSVYNFDGMFVPLDEYAFVSNLLTGAGKTTESTQTQGHTGNRFAENSLARTRVPFPRQYIQGIDIQIRDFEGKNKRFFLCGEWSGEGWWYYYLIAAAIKVPIGTWCLAVLASGLFFYDCTILLKTGVRDNRWRRVEVADELFLLAPGIIIFVFVSAQTGINEHFRYILPSFPFFYIWISRIVAESSTPKALWFHRRKFVGAALVLHGCSVVSSLSVYPHSLSYFNEIIGGPANGSKYLSSSNVDWGQDLVYLKKWLHQHPEAKPVHLSFSGGINPRVIGVDYEPMTSSLCLVSSSGEVELKPGWYAISVNNLIRATDISRSSPTALLLRNQTPIGRAGWSINVYHIE